jgi:hypothetical protein
MASESTWKRISFYAFVSLVLSALFGCSDGDRGEEPTGRSQDVLTFPLTITLTTPPSVPPTAPVLNGSSSVKFQPGAQVVSGVTVAMGSGGITTEPLVLMNETWSRGPVVLKDNSKVRGTLHAKTRTLINGATVSTWDQNPNLDPPATLSWRVNYPNGAANTVVVSSGRLPLAPGRHGNVTVNSPGKLALKTGTYYLTSLIVNSSSVVELDQANGPIVIYVTDGFTWRGSFQLLSGTDPNLLVAHLGAQPIVLETLFNGAVVAPSASLTLRSVTGTHKGFFYAKDPYMDANAKVTYRAPLALIKAATPPGADCRKFLTGLVPPAEHHLYCGGCIDRANSDRDLVLDCMDGCPYDPDKTEPGKCGCNIPDTDTDLDKTPDCHDQCDLDPNATTPGECGCLSSHPGVPPRKPAGTQCVLKPCGPSTGTATCDGQGVCGNRTTCIPAAGCRLLEYERSAYWLCPGPVNQAAAALACRNRQMALVRVNGFQESAFLTRTLASASASASPVWIGANSITASGAWRWTTATSNDGEQFWQGAATGTQRNSFFSAWTPGSPAMQRCAQLVPSTGLWVDVDCTQTAGFVCEYAAAVPPSVLIPTFGVPKQPVPVQSACMSNAAAGLPSETSGDAGIEQLQAEYDDSVDLEIHRGSAANPPDAGVDTCNEDIGSNAIGTDTDDTVCTFNPVSPDDVTCTDDASCATYGPNLFCRQVKKDSTCVTTSTNSCPGTSRCGTLTCPPRESPRRCDQREICNDQEVYNVTDVDMDSLLTPEQFDPKALFGGALPPATSAGVYDDPAEIGPNPKDHSWCFMDPQEPVPAAKKNDANKQGKAGGSSRITFSFDPNLDFDADANPLSLGETDLKVRASASLATRVQLNDFIGQTIPSREVLKAVAEVSAERCTLRTDQTQFSIFQTDFVDFLGIPTFNTSQRGKSTIFEKDWYEPTTRCNAAVGNFIETANRAKKAFRDVQQLITQFRAVKLDGGTLTNLCQSVMEVVGVPGQQPPFFPGGFNCPTNEPTEITINRFLDYYQAPGFGAISRLREAVAKLSTVTAELQEGFNFDVPFGSEPRGESKTIASASFQIGPVPVLVEVDAFYSYGAAGKFTFGFHFPYDPFSQSPVQRQSLAEVKAGVMPFAVAGLSAFVGAGKRIGPFSASVGIEGSVTLGDVKAPIFGGAGIGMESRRDERPPASDISSLADLTASAVGLDNLTHFGFPKSVKFFVWYEYGASLQLTNILSGRIDGRLRIRFAFFSRTWKKRIAQFNGFSKTFPLLSGKVGFEPGVGLITDRSVTYSDTAGKPAGASTLVVEGTNDLGVSEAQVPLLVLQPVEVPEVLAPPSPNDVAFSKAQVQGLFYDSLCCARPTDIVDPNKDQCTILGDRAERGGAVPCCPGFRCKAPTVDGFTRCVFDCRATGDSCADASQCCAVPNHDVSCDAGMCSKCGHASATPAAGAPCTQNSDCCNWDVPGSQVVCGASNTCVFQCHATGTECLADGDCCPRPPSDDGFDDVIRPVCQQNACGLCSVPAPAGEHSGFCDVREDCCGFASDPNIQCTDGFCVSG